MDQTSVLTSIESREIVPLVPYYGQLIAINDLHVVDVDVHVLVDVIVIAVKQ